MSYELAVYTKLNADVALLATLTGGLYVGENIKSVGINRTNTPSAFDSHGFLKPLAVIRGRAVIPVESIKTPSTGHRIVRQVCEIYLYADADAGFSGLNTAKDRVVTLLDMKTLPNTFALQLGAENSFREVSLNNACALRIEFNITGKR